MPYKVPSAPVPINQQGGPLQPLIVGDQTHLMPAVTMDYSSFSGESDTDSIFVPDDLVLLRNNYIQREGVRILAEQRKAGAKFDSEILINDRYYIKPIKSTVPAYYDSERSGGAPLLELDDGIDDENDTIVCQPSHPENKKKFLSHSYTSGSAPSDAYKRYLKSLHDQLEADTTSLHCFNSHLILSSSPDSLLLGGIHTDADFTTSFSQ